MDALPERAGAGLAGAERPVPALLDEALARFPDRPAMEFKGRRWSYRQLGEQVARAARGLQGLGAGKGTRVGLCLPNTPYSVILYFAALRTGATVVSFNPLYVERELLHQVRDSGTTIMALPDLRAIHAKVAAVAEPGGLRHLVVCPMAGVLPAAKALGFRLLKRRERARAPRDGRHVPYARLVADRRPPEPAAIDPHRDVAVLQYTGGTTGVPKGAMLTHANLTANSRQVVLHMPSLRPGEQRVLGVLPLFHVFALTTVLNYGVEMGAEIILQPRFELDEVLRAIEQQKPTVFPAVPTIYGAINAEAERRPRDLRSVRVCISGGAPLPAEVRSRFVALTGAHLVEGYGLTEASPVLSCNPPEGVNKPGSAGVPVAGTAIEIRDPADPRRLLPTGERGEVCARGPQVMAGYWNRPEDTAAVTVDGALRTGDIGYLDEDGYVFVVDRIKDVILCGGFNVYPRVLEEALYQHPAVAEAVVIGVPDAYRGQSPKAFVTLRPGAVATPEELLRHMGEHVSRIEVPRSVEIRDSLPRTMVGKLSRKELIAESG